MTTTATVTVPDVLVGALFVCSWGYDQTNVDFYKVLSVTKSGKSAKVQKWSSATASTEHAYGSEHVVPGEGPAMVTVWDEGVDFSTMDYWEAQQHKHSEPAPVETKRLKFGGYCGVGFTVNSYSGAYLWDGNAKYETAAGFGH